MYVSWCRILSFGTILFQGAFTSQQQITVQSEDGQSMLVNPETIIVHQNGEEVVVEDPSTGGNQYVIQYVSPDGTTQEATITGDPTQVGVVKCEHTGAASLEVGFFYA